MQLIFEKSVEGRRGITLPICDTPSYELKCPTRVVKARLPQVAEIDVVRHYINLSKQAYGVDCGFYPLGSCTMKYNPKLNEKIASLSCFTDAHPLQDNNSVVGCVTVMDRLSDKLCKITGMDAFTLQPAAGAHGEFTGIMLIKAYHRHNNDTKRNKIIVPDAAHGTNPASANMCGFTVINVPTMADGGVDVEALRSVVGEDTAGLMLTNPSTLGLFERNIVKITKIVHDAGGLMYYDGANLNAIMGIARPGDMGFDVIHLNIHKTFSTPHGGGGPGCGPVGCKSMLASFLPTPIFGEIPQGYDSSLSIGKVRTFNGNFLVALRGLAYIETLGGEGIKEAATIAVLNANYMRVKLKDVFNTPYDRICMHEFVVSLQGLKDKTGVSAMDVAKAALDAGIHPPTMYFPLIVHEALMFEPTETESKQTLDDAIKTYLDIAATAEVDAQRIKDCPHSTIIKRVDEVRAARSPVLKYDFND